MVVAQADPYSMVAAAAEMVAAHTAHLQVEEVVGSNTPAVVVAATAVAHSIESHIEVAAAVEEMSPRRNTLSDMSQHLEVQMRVEVGAGVTKVAAVSVRRRIGRIALGC